MKVLFEITEDKLDTGLRGFPVGTCSTSFVDPEKGLMYGGHPVSEMAFWKPDAVLYLLYHGKKGSKEEIAAFEQELSSRKQCKPDLIRAIEQLPREAPAMDLFAIALLLGGIYEGTGDYREDCLNSIAKIPAIGAAVINHHAGQRIYPRTEPLFDLFYILHLDHGGGNLSTFVGKAVASSLEPLWGSLAAAMTALAGSRHGRANQDSLEFLQEAFDSGKSPEQFLRDKVDHHELVYGFGHAVLRVEDPRATIFYEYAKKHFSSHPLIQLALAFRAIAPKILSENPKISDPYPNIDAITGALLTAADFGYPEYFPVLFGISRCVGIAIQIVHERLEARNGKGTPIVRPRYLYKPR